MIIETKYKKFKKMFKERFPDENFPPLVVRADQLLGLPRRKLGISTRDEILESWIEALVSIERLEKMEMI